MTRLSNEELRALFEPIRDTSPVVEDVDMDGPRKTEHRAPCAQRDLKCGECGASLVLRKSKKFQGQLFYGCAKFPECRGALGAYPDGRPKGIPANRKTAAARQVAHEVFDRLWQQQRMTRPQAYAWLQQVMELPEEAAHIGHLSFDQCERLVALVKTAYPGVRTTWERLRDPSFDATEAVLDFGEFEDV